MNLLTNRGRNLFGMILAFCGVLVLVGTFPYLSKTPVTDFWKNVGIGLQFFAAMVLAGLSWYMTNKPVTSFELIEEAQRTLGEEKELIKAWQAITIKNLKFQEMSLWMKMFYALFWFAGIACWVYALADMLSFIPPPHTLDGTGRLLPGLSLWTNGKSDSNSS
jgi:hypothetical protein